ncbi:MAG: hypothetical protein V4454_18830 [Pseudomonadota bacterium]
MVELGEIPDVETEHSFVRALMVVLAFVGLGPIPAVLISTALAIVMGGVGVLPYVLPMILVFPYICGFLPACMTGLIFWVWQRSYRSSFVSDLFVAATVGAVLAFVFGGALKLVTGSSTGQPNNEATIVWACSFGLAGLLGGAFTAVCLGWKWGKSRRKVVAG